jgi:hypothetical protein
VLSLETKNFNEAALTPLFDHEADFARLAGVLEKAGAAYSIVGAAQSGVAAKPWRTTGCVWLVRQGFYWRLLSMGPLG